MARNDLLCGAAPLALGATPHRAPDVADFCITGRSWGGDMKLQVGGHVLRVPLVPGSSPAQTAAAVVRAASAHPALRGELKVDAVGQAIVRLSLRQVATQ
jgi:hypothetical protein